MRNDEIFQIENLCGKCGKCEGNYPQNPWDEIPSECRLTGLFFLEREKIKQKIRKKKEKIIELSANLDFVSKSKKQFYLKQISQLNNEIQKFNHFGSQDW